MNKILTSVIAMATIVALAIGCGSTSPTEDSQVKVGEGKTTTEDTLCIQLINCLEGQQYCCLESTCVDVTCPRHKTWDRFTCTCVR